MLQVFIVWCSSHYSTSVLLKAMSVLTISKKSVYTLNDDEYWSEGIKSMQKATKNMKSNTVKMSHMH